MPGLPRIGLILLATDLTTERDAARLIGPDEAGMHATRVAYANPTTPENLRLMAPRLGEAAALLVPDEPLAAILFSCSSASVAIGERPVRDAIAVGRPGVPVITPTDAACEALAALGARRIALLTPYLPVTSETVAAHFTSLGFDLVRSRCMGLADDREMARVLDAAILAAAREADSPEADALFISCTALPALAVAARIEAAIGKPVVTSNGASLWRLRRLAGLASPLPGYGRLFEAAPAETVA